MFLGDFVCFFVGSLMVLDEMLIFYVFSAGFLMVIDKMICFLCLARIR